MEIPLTQRAYGSKGPRALIHSERYTCYECFLYKSMSEL